jgi:hypothetical protein
MGQPRHSFISPRSHRCHSERAFRCNRKRKEESVFQVNRSSLGDKSLGMTSFIEIPLRPTQGVNKHEVLRLRSCPASPASISAQDDSFDLVSVTGYGLLRAESAKSLLGIPALFLLRLLDRRRLDFFDVHEVGGIFTGVAGSAVSGLFAIMTSLL